MGLIPPTYGDAYGDGDGAYGHGDGDGAYGYGYGYGDAYGDGHGDGAYGDGYGYGNGYGNGYGYGYGDAYGNGHGDGAYGGGGYGYGNGYGDAYGNGHGDGAYGYGYGYGDAYGDGHGDGAYGHGDGDGHGGGNGYGNGPQEYWVSALEKITQHKNTAYWWSNSAGRPTNGGSNIGAAYVGKVDQITGDYPVLCGAGALHATQNPSAWKGDRLWIVEVSEPWVATEDKIGTLKRTIIGEFKLGSKNQLKE